MRSFLRGLAGIASVAVACTLDPAHSQTVEEVGRQLADMRLELQAQRSLIESQAKRIDEQQQELDRLRVGPAIVSGAPAPTDANVVRPARSSDSTMAVALPDRPVGGAPEPARVEEQAQALPEGMGVLTRPGHFVLEPSLEYTNSSSSRLVFRGIELVPGIQIGQIDAGTADRDTLVATATARYGLTENLEFEARVPYLRRSDRTTEIQQRDETMTRAFHLKQDGLGDVEFALRYQFNHPIGERPIFVGSLRVKTDTGRSPFSVPFDDAGVAKGLATGSGFWAVQPGLSFLLPSEPAVIFGGASFLYGIPRDVDRQVGSVLIGRVHPGNAISGNIGFGFALNPRFSFSLGYEHTYITPMQWELDGIVNRTSRLQVGSFTLGMSYRVTPRQPLNFSVDVGATREAPDVSVVLRVPIAPG